MADADVAAAMAGSFLGELPSELVGRCWRRASAPTTRRADDLSAGFVSEGAAGRSWLAAGLYERSRGSTGDGPIRPRPAMFSGSRSWSGGRLTLVCQTLAESTLFRIDPATLTAAAHRDARVAWALAEELNRGLYETLQQTAINAFGSVRQRVAAHLLDLASAQQRPRGHLVARVSQQELADAVGSVREVVARVLRDLRLARPGGDLAGQHPHPRPGRAARPVLEPDRRGG